jgi:apolipoprotein N-acyltransferase
VGWWPVAFVALAPLLWLVRASRPRRSLLLGLVFGLVYYGLLLSWILLFGELAWTVLVLRESIWAAAFGLLAPLLWRGTNPIRSSIGLAALWTVLDWFRSMVPVGGFSWGALGTSQAPNPTLLPLASVTGVWGMTFVVLLVNALLLLVLHRLGRPRRNLAAAGFALAAVLLVVAPGVIPPAEPDGGPVDVAAIQVAVPKDLALDPDFESRSILGMHVEQHLALAEDPPELIVWGENSLSGDPTTEPELDELLSTTIATTGSPTLVNAITHDGEDDYNENLFYDGQGRLVDRYAKQHLVPYGEYVPFRRYLNWISALDQITWNYTAAESGDPIQGAGLRFASVICFENIFPSLDRRLVAQGADFIVVSTNNASYLRTAASSQHLQFSQVRAVENGRWLVHAAISGISAFVDPSGNVYDQTPLFETTTIRRTIVGSSERTIYNLFGDWLSWVALAFVVVLLLMPRRRDHLLASRSGELPGEPRPRTLVILPTYDEAETIREVLDRVRAVAPEVDILVVDDGSPDGTARLVEAAAAEEGSRVSLVERDRKSGLASAYMIGFRRALDEGYDLVVEMDSDLSHQPEELPALLEAARERYDLTIGSRYVPGVSVTNWGLIRRALSRWGNVYVRLALGMPVTDATSGYRVYRRPLLEHLLERPIKSDGYAFQIELAYRSWYAGFAVGEVPITFKEREHGHSKISRAIVAEALWLVGVWGLRDRLRVPRPGPQPVGAVPPAAEVSATASTGGAGEEDAKAQDPGSEPS